MSPQQHRLLVLADSVGATQHIFFGQPLAEAVASGRVVLKMAADDPAWDHAAAREACWETAAPTLLVLSRYSNARALAFLQLARARGVPVLFHIDDDLLDVPLSLGRAKHDLYRRPERLATLRRALDDSDLVYASTEAMAERLRQHGVRTPVVAGPDPCAVDPTAAPEPLPALVPVIGYMGTGGHSQDLAIVMPAVAGVLHDHPDARFETFGTIKPPAEMAAFDGRYLHHPGIADYERFVERLGCLGWWIGIAPLEDNAFNRCKIDTKWVEYTYAGVAVVATGLPVYERACAGGAGLLVPSPPDWRRALEGLLVDGRRRSAQLQRARQRLLERHADPDRRQRLFDIVEQATASRPR